MNKNAKLRSSYAREQEKGQILVLAALCLTVAIGFAALAIDIGNWLHTRTELQADVDALALGAAQKLPDTGAATSVAERLKDPNKLLASDDVRYSFAEQCDGSAIPDQSMVTVRAKRHNPSFLAQVVGISGADIEACATAGKFGLGGAFGVRPFALEDNCIDEVAYGDVVTIKADSDTTRNCDAATGNFQAVAVNLKAAPDTYDTGDAPYIDTIKNGGTTYLCTDSTAGCCPTLTSDSCIGIYEIKTQTGNLANTKKGIRYLFDGTPAECDTFSEVASKDADGNVVLNNDCVPWSETYTALGTHLIVIPVVDGLWDSGGNNIVTIKKFAIVFLESGTCGISRVAPAKSGQPGDAMAALKAYAAMNPDAAVRGSFTSFTGGAEGPALGAAVPATATPTKTPTKTPTPAGPTATPVPPTATATPKGTGSDCDINARFIKTVTSLSGAARIAYGGGADAQIVALVQ